MQDINIKFKDSPPEETVKKIQGILDSLGIKVEERWNNTGIENCHSLNLQAVDAYPLTSNGKGISKALARASAYGEFIERIQCGLMMYKYQSIARLPSLYLPSFAPDCKFVTKQELMENGDWMDYLTRAYGKQVSREKIAELCRIYSCADQDDIRVVPYYSLFEKKYVYMPAGFVEQVYATNGCCAGNSREEAWVHALSEILERHSSISMITKNKALPEIPEEVLRRYPVASSILDKIHSNEALDVKIFDASDGLDYPIVATRVINKASHGYHVNVCADPILEIAIDRTLTETFQGRQLDSVGSEHDAITYEEVPNFPMTHNVFNQLETGNGLFSVDFFTEELTCDREFTGFTDHSTKNNKELLEHVLSVYKAAGNQIYVRNCSFLGFHCYHIVVPGFSEARALDLTAPVSNYALGDRLYNTFRNVEAASSADLLLFLTYYRKNATLFSWKYNFSRHACLPMHASQNYFLMHITLAYAAYKLNKLPLCAEYLKPLLSQKDLDADTQDYLKCVAHYFSLRNCNVADDQIRLLLQKFYMPESAQRLFDCLDSGKTPFDAYLMRCENFNCSQCRYQEHCSYTACTKIFETVGKHYGAFTDGQNEEIFKI